MGTERNTITISCLCGTARQTLRPRGDADIFSRASFCHCGTCRHSTGILFASYAPISSNPAPSLTGLESYSSSPSVTRYFCSTCGCHIFRVKHASPSSPPEEWDWDVATGVITDAPETESPPQWHHQYIEDTIDGGLSQWFPDTGPLPKPTQELPLQEGDDTLSASCHCTSVSLLINRPSVDLAANPDSPYPDLLYPSISTPAVFTANPSHEKWYLRPVPSATPAEKQTPAKYRYLAGTCACQPCRLASGSELQTWAFIPRQNIFIRCSPSSFSATQQSTQSTQPNQTIQLDQTNQPSQQHHKHHENETPSYDHQPPHPNIPEQYQPLTLPIPPSNPPDFPLKSYPSTPNRTRTFCRNCGATLFWHDSVARPDLVDVSAGLFSHYHHHHHHHHHLFSSPSSTKESGSAKEKGASSTNEKGAASTKEKGASSTKEAPSSKKLGARAEDWLEWWTGRVSFSEEAGRGRSRGARKFGEGVVSAVEACMKKGRGEDVG